MPLLPKTKDSFIAADFLPLHPAADQLPAACFSFLLAILLFHDRILSVPVPRLYQQISHHPSIHALIRVDPKLFSKRFDLLKQLLLPVILLLARQCIIFLYLPKLVHIGI